MGNITKMGYITKMGNITQMGNLTKKARERNITSHMSLSHSPVHEA